MVCIWHVYDMPGFFYILRRDISSSRPIFYTYILLYKYLRFSFQINRYLHKKKPQTHIYITKSSLVFEPPSRPLPSPQISINKSHVFCFARGGWEGGKKREVIGQDMSIMLCVCNNNNTINAFANNPFQFQIVFLSFSHMIVGPAPKPDYSTTNRSISSNQPIAAAFFLPIPNNLKSHTSSLDAPLLLHRAYHAIQYSKKKKSFVHFGGKMAKSKVGFYHNFLCWQTGRRRTDDLPHPNPNPPIPSRTPGVLGDV